MNAARQSWVQTLGEAFPNDQPLRQERVAEVALQSLKKISRSNHGAFKNDFQLNENRWEKK